MKNIGLFVLFIALAISWLNLKMQTPLTERPADESIDPTPAQSLFILGALSHHFQMRRTDLPKGREQQGGEQSQGEMEQGLLWGPTGTDPEMPILLHPDWCSGN